jgi:gluconate 2-dehydrogenase gamma chain
MTKDLSRRDLLKTVGAAGVAATVPGSSAAEEHRHLAQLEGANANQLPAPAADEVSQRGVLFFFNDPEAKFIEAAVERLIPSDAEWPGAGWAGVLSYIDRQLAGAFGVGARMYLEGPWVPEAPPQQGYQLRYTPAQLYRIGIEETRQFVLSRYDGLEFWDLGPPVMDDVLAGLESGSVQLPSIPSTVFFETLLANTVEGYFADPAYGGNRDMVSWRMVGFPGAYAQYIDLVELYNLPYTRPPIGMANQSARREHLHGHRE